MRQKEIKHPSHPSAYGGCLRKVARQAAIVWAVLIPTLALGAEPQAPLRFARIENIPDQMVGGEILRAVYRRLGIPIELVDLTAQRALKESSEGRLDGEVQRNARVQQQYPTLVMVTPAINYIEPSVFSKRYRFHVSGWDAIRTYEIGIVRGVGTSEDGTQGMERVQRATSLDQLMLLVARDRVDVAVSDAFSGLASLKKLGLEGEVKLLTPPLQKTEIYHFLHEKHRDLVPRVAQAIREMQASGELERVRRQAMERYLAQQRRGPAEE